MFHKMSNKKFKKKSYIRSLDNLNDINKYEFKKTSQNNEDGIIEFIFQKIGLEKINFVEIGFDFYQNNSLNFLNKVNTGLYIDGSEDKVIKLKSILSILYPFKNVSVVNKFIARTASSLPGNGKSIPTGSQLVSTKANVLMPRIFASARAIFSFCVSIMKRA